MPTFLEQLENNEAILLMYLAGELSQEDRDEVEAMLSRDAGMRAALAELTALHAEVNSMIAGVDGATALAGREMAIGRVMRSLKQAADREPAPTQYVNKEPHRTLRIGWWVYPLAAAALFMVSMILWSGNTPVKLGPSDPTKIVKGDNEWEDQQSQRPEILFAQLVEPAPQDSLAKIEDELAQLSSRNTGTEVFPAGWLRE
jgi:anti-sigma factor RsiW